MNFWVISPNVKDDGDIDYWLKRIKNENKVFVNYEDDSKHGMTFKNTINKGDIIIIAHGAKDNRKIYFAGEVISNVKSNDVDGANFRLLDKFLETGLLRERGVILNSKNAYGESKNPGTIYKLHESNKYDYNVMRKIIEIFDEKNKILEMEKYIRILKYKKQIILQGAPGTGKTKLAKELAVEFTKGKNTVGYYDKIIEYLKGFKVDEQKNKLREISNNLLKSFAENFTLDRIKTLDIDDYVIGKGNTDSFCYWLEFKLKNLGLYSGYSTKFKLYWNDAEQQYGKVGFVKDLSDDIAIENIRLALADIYAKKNLLEVSKKMSDAFVLKVLNSYYPDEFFPILKKEYIDKVLKLLKIDFNKKDSVFAKNQLLQNEFKVLINKFNVDITNLEFMHFLFEEFDIKGDLEFENESIITKGDYQIIQFHPSYSYEDFVRSISSETKDGKLNYTIKNKILLEFIEKALKQKKSNFVLVIDEINRANLPSVLGELIYALEYREKTVKGLYKIEDTEDIYELKDYDIVIPNNIYIIGTMNTADRSVGHIDYAIRRRFAFVDVLPKVLNDVSFEKALFEEVSKFFVENINDKPLKRSEYLSSEFNPKDVWLGHSYFIKKDGVESSIRLEYEIKPILEEYLKDGILIDNDEIRNKIENLHTFLS
jgi:5-methylcytosine-specific restriction protein B